MIIAFVGPHQIFYGSWPEVSSYFNPDEGSLYCHMESSFYLYAFFYPYFPDGTGGSGGRNNRPRLDLSTLGSPSDRYNHYGRPPGVTGNGSHRQQPPQRLHLDFTGLSLQNNPSRQQPSQQTSWVGGGATFQPHHSQQT